MSSTPSEVFDQKLPAWFSELLGLPGQLDEKAFLLRDVKLKFERGILRADTLISKEQAQTEDVFGFKWHKRDTFESEASQQLMREWSVQRYGEVTAWLPEKDRGSESGHEPSCDHGKPSNRQCN